MYVCVPLLLARISLAHTDTHTNLHPLSSLIGTGLPQDVWLAMALKQNNAQELQQQKLLGVPNVPAIAALLRIFEARVLKYVSHFENIDVTTAGTGPSRGDHKTSRLFLQGELHQLETTVAWLKREVASMGGEQGLDQHKGAQENWDL